ncbi:uncharacterized protein LOC118512990 [Anopheles stephensi]|uniref:uncharacterized protein LOC118512990 n=1 Tax=Anopheles stephensi TaxID=30069 RepID=UPI0016589A20|nr:uncharacterized protein LOC118512990 [Anopheles stephensi]
MAQVKYEPLEDDIDDIDTSMRHLIEQADWFLDSLRSRPSYNNSSSSANESNASSSRESAQTSSSSTAQPEQGSTTTTMGSAVSSVNQDEPSNDSSGSDTTILCSHDELMPDASTPIPLVDDSFAQEVIVIGTPAIEPRTSQLRARRRARRALNRDTSVIDLSNYQEPEPVVIISSDEEDNIAPSTVQTSFPVPIPQPLPSGSWSSFTVGGLAVSVHTSPTQNISVALSRHLADDSSVEVSMLESRPAPVTATQPARRPAPPSASPAPNTNLNETRTSRGVDIICPICYETLANRQALSTACGHVFCAVCLRRSLKLAKKCPVCKKGLTKANGMHPVYFATE